MFDPKKEVPSLELCRKLKEISYPQDKYGFYWVRLKGSLVNENEWDLIYWNEEHIRWDERGKYILLGGCDCCADYLAIIEKIKAPVYPEIEKWLPISLDCVIENSPYSAHHRLIMWKSVDGYWCGYIPYNCKFEDFKGIQVTGEDWRIKQWGETLIEACTKMLIWLIEKGYVKFKMKKKICN